MPRVRISRNSMPLRHLHPSSAHFIVYINGKCVPWHPLVLTAPALIREHTLYNEVHSLYHTRYYPVIH